MTADFLDRIRDALSRPPERPDREPDRVAAVAAVLLPNGDVLFLKRADHPSDPWSGHVAFPGGRMDPGDPSPLHAAIREAHEELGLDLSRAEVLGELDTLTTPAMLPLLAVHPFVFALDHEPAIVPNREVQSVHRLGLDALLSGEGRGTMPWTWQGKQIWMPRVDFDGVRLWGMTLRAVDDLLDRLDGGTRRRW